MAEAGRFLWGGGHLGLQIYFQDSLSDKKKPCLKKQKDKTKGTNNNKNPPKTKVVIASHCYHDNYTVGTFSLLLGMVVQPCKVSTSEMKARDEKFNRLQGKFKARVGNMRPPQKT